MVSVDEGCIRLSATDGIEREKKTRGSADAARVGQPHPRAGCRGSTKKQGNEQPVTSQSALGGLWGLADPKKRRGVNFWTCPTSLPSTLAWFPHFLPFPFPCHQKLSCSCASCASCISHHAVAWVCSTCRRDLPPRSLQIFPFPTGSGCPAIGSSLRLSGCRAPLTDVVTRPPSLPHSPSNHPCHQPPNPTNTGALRPNARGLMLATVAATGTCVCSDQYGVTEYHSIDPSTMLLEYANMSVDPHTEHEGHASDEDFTEPRRFDIARSGTSSQH